jgi:hypothetical protein
MKTLAIAIATAALLAGCGGSKSADDATPAAKKAPDNGQLARIAPAVTGIPLSCLDRAGADSGDLQHHVDALVAVYHETDPDVRFKLAPNAPSVTMRKLLTSARDALQACSDAGQSSAAASLVARVNGVLDAS